MNSEEKIRIVLETLGVDSIKDVRKELKALSEEADAVGDALDDVGDKSAPKAKKALDSLENGLEGLNVWVPKVKKEMDGLGNEVENLGKKVEKTVGKGGGKGMSNGQSLLALSYFFDDLQYGMHGVMNNIPGVAQALGLGAGLAGVAGVAGVAIGQLVDKHPEWFKWSDKISAKLKELADNIKAEEEAIALQKKAIDELGKSNSTRIGDIIKLQKATEDLKITESELANDRAAQKALEDADANIGETEKEDVASQKQSFKERFTDTGELKALKTDLMRDAAKAGPDLTEKAIQQRNSAIMKKEGEVDFVTPQGVVVSADRKKFRQQAIAELQGEGYQDNSKRVGAIIAAMQNAKTIEELNTAFNDMAEFSPENAKKLKEYHQTRIISEQTDKEVDKSIEQMKTQRANRGKDEKSLDAAMAFGPNRQTLDNATDAKAIADRALGVKKSDTEMANEAAIRNNILNTLNPYQMAAQRQINSGMGPNRNNNLAALRARDMNATESALMARGMRPSDAQEAAAQSTKGGEQQFVQFAQATGANTKSAVAMNRAAIAAMQRIEAQQRQQQAQMELLTQQANQTGNAGRTTQKPQFPRMRP